MVAGTGPGGGGQSRQPDTRPWLPGAPGVRLTAWLGDLDRPTTSRLGLPVLLATGAAGVALSWFVAGHSLLGARWNFVLLLAAWAALWIVGARAARQVGTRTCLLAVVALAVLLRLAAATGTTPSISSDAYRYSWDAQVQLSGTDPYRYPPTASQLTDLRRPPVWPTLAGCRHVGQDHPGCTLITRANVRTIYPPVAEAWFVVVHALAGGDSGSRPWQLAGGLTDVATVVLIIILLRGSRRDPRQVAWYALAPLPIVEFAGNGHVDSIALLLLCAALLALRRGWRAWAGILVGLATMITFYPALALVAGWRRGRWRFVLAAAATVVASEVPHVIAVGTRVLGYLPGYLREEHYSSGGRFLLVGLLGLPGSVTTGLAIAILAVVVACVARSRLQPDVGLAVLLGALLLIATPVQPWYAVTAAGIGVSIGAPWLLVIGVVAEPYYAAVVLDDPHQVTIGRIAYAVAALVVIGGLAERRIRRRHPARPILDPGRQP